MLAKIISVLLGLFISNATGAVEPSAPTKLVTLASIGGAVLWILGPGRALHYDLNLLEMCAILLAGALIGEVLRHAPPPGG